MVSRNHGKKPIAVFGRPPFNGCGGSTGRLAVAVACFAGEELIATAA